VQGRRRSGACLTAPQAEAARKIYGPAKNPRTGKEIFPGLAPGSELVWGALAGGPKPFPIPEDHFKYVVFKDPDWDWRTLNFEKDVALADKFDNGTLNATDPNLRKFAAHGGKLILYHGWNDQADRPAKQRQLLHQRHGGDGRPAPGGEIHPPFHGAGDGPLRGRSWTEHV